MRTKCDKKNDIVSDYMNLYVYIFLAFWKKT